MESKAALEFKCIQCSSIAINPMKCKECQKEFMCNICYEENKRERDECPNCRVKA